MRESTGELPPLGWWHEKARQVRNVRGTGVLRQTAPGLLVRLDVASLPKGAYLLTVPLAQ